MLPLSLLVSDGLHTPSCGLSLWQHQDGEVPPAAASSCEQQDKGNTSLFSRVLYTYVRPVPRMVLMMFVYPAVITSMSRMTGVTLVLASRLSLCLVVFDHLHLHSSRWATPLSTRRLSKATPISWPCCWNTEPSRMRSLRWGTLWRTFPPVTLW